MAPFRTSIFAHAHPAGARLKSQAAIHRYQWRQLYATQLATRIGVDQNRSGHHSSSRSDQDPVNDSYALEEDIGQANRDHLRAPGHRLVDAEDQGGPVISRHATSPGMSPL